MRKIVSFLGTEDYHKTPYRYGEKCVETKYAPLAVAKFFPDHELHILLTDEAFDRNWRGLESELRSQGVRFKSPVFIKAGINQDELWEIFDQLSRQMSERDELVFDITFSFRSLPFLTFLAIAYLRVARQIDLKAVLYAAYPESSRLRHTPVLDLTPFVALLNWTTATDLFLKTGRAADLAGMLKSVESPLKADADTLEQVSAALRLARPDEARRLAHQWAQMLHHVRPDSLNAGARPFALLLERVRNEFEKIAPEEPDPGDIQQELRREMEIMKWNFSRGQILSAVTIAREWLVSLMCWHAAWDRRGRDREEKAEKKALAALGKVASGTLDVKSGPLPEGARELYDKRKDYAELIGRIWNKVSRLRNDLDHAGKIHTDTPRPLRSVLSEAEGLPDELQKVFDQSGLG